MIYLLFNKVQLSVQRKGYRIHGCFWHGHTCKRGALPETNIEFWENKIGGNIERDKRDVSELQTQGWNVIVIWQCEIKNIDLQNERLAKLLSEIKSISINL
jgi:DNA mismatch endonuclease (patch repair protein)